MKKSLMIMALILCEGLFLTGCISTNSVEVIQGQTMGTTYTIKFLNPLKLDVENVQFNVDDRLKHLNEFLSTYIETSDISLLNQNTSTDWVEISVPIFLQLKLAEEIWTLSDGFYDPTVGPLVNLWGFGPLGPQKLPTLLKVKEVAKSVGLSKTNNKVEGEKFFFKKSHPKTYLDFSAQAKGHGVDAVAKRLENLGLKNFMVEIGGEILVRGKKGKEPWKLGIETPALARSGQVVEVLNLKDMSMATSGDYRNFLKLEGKTYSHTINPKTGMPVKHTLASVTVLDSTCARADGLATALMALGPDKGFQLVENAKIPALFIVREHGQGAKKFIIKKSSEYLKLIREKL